MDRRVEILRRAERDGRVFVDTLASALNVSAHTIRRDINALCAAERLRRLHGGAEYVEPKCNLPYGVRSVLNASAKLAIARAVAGLVPDGATVFLSVGTTPALVARALSGHRGLTAVTNNLNAAMAVSEAEDVRVIVPGGQLRLPDLDVLNEQAIALFATYRADFGIYGVGGIDGDGSLLDFHEEEVRVRECIRAGARKSILVADRSKFGRRTAALGGRLEDADHIVLDTAPDAPFDALVETLGDRITLASEIEANHV
jgi:DeoR family glycerol-3-phosphate regulon repressor